LDKRTTPATFGEFAASESLQVAVGVVVPPVEEPPEVPDPPVVVDATQAPFWHEPEQTTDADWIEFPEQKNSVRVVEEEQASSFAEVEETVFPNTEGLFPPSVSPQVEAVVFGEVEVPPEPVDPLPELPEEEPDEVRHSPRETTLTPFEVATQSLE
jgi:hypothetical protein